MPISIGGLDISFTNSALWMAIAVALVYALVMLGSRHASMVPGRLQSLVELSYEFIGNMVGGTVGKEGRRYFPFIFTLFMFILFGNILGMVPGSFTYTSHIVVTFTMAIFVVTAVTIMALPGTAGISSLSSRRAAARSTCRCSCRSRCCRI